jgi:ribosomal protein L16/L10AE
MFERSFILALRHIDNLTQWTLRTKRGRVVAMGAAGSEKLALRMASKKLPRHSRITKIEVEHE